MSNKIWLKASRMCLRIIFVMQIFSISFQRPSVRQEVKQIKRNAESKANLIRIDINWTFAVDNDKSARNFPGSDIMIAGQRRRARLRGIKPPFPVRGNYL